MLAISSLIWSPFMMIADDAEGVGVAANPAVTFSSAAAAADVAESVNSPWPAWVVDMARATRREGLLVDQRVSFTAARLRYHERTL